jgi:hypothetical protein
LFPHDYGMSEEEIGELKYQIRELQEKIKKLQEEMRLVAAYSHTLRQQVLFVASHKGHADQEPAEKFRDKYGIRFG